MSGFRPSTERPTVYPFNGKSENLQHDFSQKQSGETRNTHLQPHEQSRGSRTGKDHQYGRPGYQTHYDETANLDFYQNKKRFEPNGVYIEELLTKWKDDYKRLEVNHSYIQWLFPLQKHGKNPKAKPLTDHEIEAMKEDTTVMDRFLRAYELMLGFYGIKLHNKATGSVARNSNYLERFENLNNYTHNNLRITRILKCLALLGYEHFQAPLVKFFLEETLLYNNLKNVKSSATHHFLLAVKDDKECCDLKKYESSLKTSKESEIRNKRKEECRPGSVSSWPKQKSN
ncbi:opioid growth factor receptor-like protein 1 isoform X2 [Rana temporaria]|uniref:opioid growth factor receptor-like protein 1 isoform X2 n=1 Tax=Rana temporaria TaxID=8407 RepID=UPI001AAC955D|nr:opioid growth factor receptor-like protein 1 isoform X2 [Rana temporaria]